MAPHIPSKYHLYTDTFKLAVFTLAVAGIYNIWYIIIIIISENWFKLSLIICSCRLFAHNIMCTLDTINTKTNRRANF